MILLRLGRSWRTIREDPCQVSCSIVHNLLYRSPCCTSLFSDQDWSTRSTDLRLLVWAVVGQGRWGGTCVAAACEKGVATGGKALPRGLPVFCVPGGQLLLCLSRAGLLSSSSTAHSGPLNLLLGRAVLVLFLVCDRGSQPGETSSPPIPACLQIHSPQPQKIFP